MTVNRREAPRAPGPIVIRVTVERSEPLTGTASAGPGEPIRFEGWLDLLETFSTLVRDGATPT